MGVIVGNPYFQSCDPIYSGRGGVVWDRMGHRTYTVRWKVIVKERGMSAVSVCLCPGLPVPASFYVAPQGFGALEFDELALCTNISAAPEMEDDWQSWIVTYTYSTEVPDTGVISAPGFPGDASSAQNNPELEFPDVRWGSETVQMAFQHDRDGNLYFASNRLPFVPSRTRPVSHLVLSISRNEINYNAVKADEYTNAINDKLFLGFPRGTVMCMPPDAQQKWKGRKRFWRVSYKLKVQGMHVPNGTLKNKAIRVPSELYPPYNPALADNVPVRLEWQPRVLDAGLEKLHHKIKDGKDFWYTSKIRDEHNHVVTHPWPLNGNGQKADRDEATGAIKPIYLSFRDYEYKDFSKLIVQGLA